jgi:hypothetical protein
MNRAAKKQAIAKVLMGLNKYITKEEEMIIMNIIIF